MTDLNKHLLTGAVAVAAVGAVWYLAMHRSGGAAAGPASSTETLSIPSDGSGLYSIGGLNLGNADKAPFSLVPPPSAMFDFGGNQSLTTGNIITTVNQTGSADGATGSCGCGCSGGAGSDSYGSVEMLAKAALPLIQNMVAHLPNSVSDAWGFQYYGT